MASFQPRNRRMSDRREVHDLWYAWQQHDLLHWCLMKMCSIKISFKRFLFCVHGILWSWKNMRLVYSIVSHPVVKTAEFSGGKTWHAGAPGYCKSCTKCLVSVDCWHCTDLSLVEHRNNWVSSAARFFPKTLRPKSLESNRCCITCSIWLYVSVQACVFQSVCQCTSGPGEKH